MLDDVGRAAGAAAGTGAGTPYRPRLASEARELAGVRRDHERATKPLPPAGRFGQGGEGAGIDEAEYARQIAELAAPAMGTSVASGAPDTPDVQGWSWRTSRSLVGDEIETTLSDQERELWDVLLEAAGTGYGQAGGVVGPSQTNRLVVAEL